MTPKVANLIVRFSESVVDKNYTEADKYLHAIIEEKLKVKIQAAAKKEIFKNA